MKVLFLSAEPIRSRQASATHINEIVRGLSSAGNEVTTCVSRVMGPYDRTSLLMRFAGYLVFWFEGVRQLRRTELAYARAHPANFPLAVAAWLMNVPTIHEINGPFHDVALTHSWLSPFMPVVRALYRFQYRKADALIAVTDGLADWVRNEAPGVPVYVVPNGVNCDLFNPTKPPTKTIGRSYALFFGGLTRWHGVETILSAIEQDAWPLDTDLVIIGEGQLSNFVREASTRNPNIHALPSMPQEMLIEYITGASVGLVPINSIGGRGRLGLSPLKLYEMLACGLPVVVTDFPGQAELVRDLDAGIVIPPDNPVALAVAVAALRAAPPPREKMTRVASIIKTEHSWTTRVTEIGNILSNVVSQTNKSR